MIARTLLVAGATLLAACGGGGSAGVTIDKELVRPLTKVDPTSLADDPTGNLLFANPETFKNSFPTGADLESAYAAMSAGMPTNMSWESAGPQGFGGRTRALAFDPNDASGKKVWAGAVTGGLWVNNDITDPAGSWTPLADSWPNLNISCIAFDPSRPQIMFVGTGEIWNSHHPYSGYGIWRSEDGGNNFVHVSSTKGPEFRFVQDLVVHPTTGDLYAATKDNGLVRSEDGGVVWEKVLGLEAGGITNEVADIEITAGGTILATLGINKSEGIYRSNSGDVNSWERTYDFSWTSRIELAAAPSDENTIYAATAYGSSLNGLFVSSDAGATWEELSLDFMENNYGAFYSLSLTVDPSNADHVWLGMVDVFESTDRGGSWTLNKSAGNKAHALVYHSNGSLILGNDEGIRYSSNGTNLEERNIGYNTAHINSIHATDDDVIMSTMEYGTIRGTAVMGRGEGHSNSMAANDITLIGRSFGRFLISSDGQNFYSTDNEAVGLFNVPSVYMPETKVLFMPANDTGVRRLAFMPSEDGLECEDRIIGSGLTYAANCLVRSPHDEQTLLTANDLGELMMISNVLGVPGAASIASGGLPKSPIANLAFGSSNKQILVIYRNGHIWETADGGASWKNKTGDLPALPVWDAQYHPGGQEVYLATDLGVWVCQNLGAGSVKWTKEASLPSVPVRDIYLDADRTLWVATHGRGVFRSEHARSAQ